jgi:hypothetical protein
MVQEMEKTLTNGHKPPAAIVQRRWTPEKAGNAREAVDQIMAQATEER